jgi:membrane protein insertase Oxa1/YidC/SpoIIIJ
MPELGPDKPHLGWKLYWGLSALLTAGALPMLVARPSLVACLNEAMSFVSLAGVFGYAWAVKVPGPRIFWRIVAILSAALILVPLTTLITKAGPHASAQAMNLAIMTILFLTVPTSVALLRYSSLIPGRKPSRTATLLARVSAARAARNS